MSHWTSNTEPVTGEQGYPREQYRVYVTYTSDETGNTEVVQHWTPSRIELNELWKALRAKFALRPDFAIYADTYRWPAKDCKPEVTPMTPKGEERMTQAEYQDHVAKLRHTLKERIR